MDSNKSSLKSGLLVMLIFVIGIAGLIPASAGSFNYAALSGEGFYNFAGILNLAVGACALVMAAKYIIKKYE